MFAVSIMIFINVAIVQLQQIPTTESLFLNRRFPRTSNANIYAPSKNNIVETDIIFRDFIYPRTNVLYNGDDHMRNNLVAKRSRTDSECSSCACRSTHVLENKISGGETAEENEFPWMAALIVKGNFYCGAMVITKQHILTAAHCVKNITAEQVQASLGEYNRALKNETNKIIMGIKEIIRHPEFQVSQNDIAILKLNSSIPFNTSRIQSACLPSSKNRNYTGLNATVIGWGRIGDKMPPSNVLRKTEVPIISLEDCRNISGYKNLPYKITDDMMCAGYIAGNNTGQCQGDSGGPLQIDNDGRGTIEVIGIASWSYGCARKSYPGVFTRIEKYMNWIDDNIDTECLCKV